MMQVFQASHPLPIHVFQIPALPVKEIVQDEVRSRQAYTPGVAKPAKRAK